MRSISLYFQVHQPNRLRTYRFFDIGKRHDYYDEYLNRHIAKKVAEKCYLPANQMMLDLIQKYGSDFSIAYSISGIALEQFEKYTPEVIKSFQKLAETGQVEFLAETYAHSLASLKTKEEFKQQVEQHRQKIKELFNYNPKVFRNTELIYSDEIGAMVADLGYKTMLTEGAKHVLGWKSPNYLYANSINPKLKVLLKNFRLSDDIAFRFSDRSWEGWPLTAEKFASWLNDLDKKDEVINLFMDYETIGEHQWVDTGIFEFFKALPKAVFDNTEFKFRTPGQVAKKLQPVSAVQVPYPISWADEERDLTAWVGNELQDEAFDKLYNLEEKVHQCNDEEILHDWLSLQTSDHFYYMCTKWFSDGEVHSYFNPYGSPYDAFINYMNILSDFILRVNQKCSEESQSNAKKEEKVLRHQKTRAPEKQKTNRRAKQPDTFNDLRKTPKTVLKKVLRQVTIKTVATALYNSDEELKEHLLSNLGKRAMKEYEIHSKDKPNTEMRSHCRQEILDLTQQQY